MRREIATLIEGYGNGKILGIDAKTADVSRYGSGCRRVPNAVLIRMAKLRSVSAKPGPPETELRRVHPAVTPRADA